MYNLLLSVGFELCSSYHKKEKQTLELHPFCCSRIVRHKIAFPVAYFDYQDCTLAFASSEIAMLKFSVYVPNRAPVISVCPDTKTKI